MILFGGNRAIQALSHERAADSEQYQSDDQSQRRGGDALITCALYKPTAYRAYFREADAAALVRR